MIILSTAVVVFGLLASVPRTSAGFFFRGPEAADSQNAEDHGDISALWRELRALKKQIAEQQEIIDSLHSTIKNNRILSNSECLLTFFNETGTPMCKLNHQLSADHGLLVPQNATATFRDAVFFKDEVEFSDDVSFRPEADVTFRGYTTFENRTFFDHVSRFNGDVDFHDKVNFRDNVEFHHKAVFRDSVEFLSKSIVTFNGLTTFKNFTSFDRDVRFRKFVGFLDEVYFDQNVKFGYSSDVVFYDTVSFYDHVTIQGPRRHGRVRFNVKDRVEMNVEPTISIAVDAETYFYKDVAVKERPCRSHSSKRGSSCKFRRPELYVSGDIIGERDLRIKGALLTDKIAPIAPSNQVTIHGDLRVRGSVDADSGLVGPSVSVTSLHSNGDITVGRRNAPAVRLSSSTGSITAIGSITTDSTINAVGNINSQDSLTAGPVGTSRVSMTASGGSIDANGPIATASTINAVGNINSQNSVTSGPVGASTVSLTGADGSVTAGAIAATSLDATGTINSQSLITVFPSTAGSALISLTATAGSGAAPETAEAGRIIANGDIESENGNVIAGGSALRRRRLQTVNPSTGGGIIGDFVVTEIVQNPQGGAVVMEFGDSSAEPVCGCDLSPYIMLQNLTSGELALDIASLRASGEISTGSINATGAINTEGIFTRAGLGILEGNSETPDAATGEFLTASDLAGGTLTINASSILSQSTIQAVGDITSLEGVVGSPEEGTCGCDLEPFVTVEDLGSGELNVTFNSLVTSSIDAGKYSQNGDPFTTEIDSESGQVIDTATFLTAVDLEDYLTLAKLQSMDVAVNSVTAIENVSTIDGTFLKGEKDITDVTTPEGQSTEGFLTAVDLSSGKLEINASNIISQSTIEAVGNITSLEGSLSPIPEVSGGETTCACDLDAFVTSAALEAGNLEISVAALNAESIVTKSIESEQYLQTGGTPLVIESDFEGRQDIDTSSFLTEADVAEFLTLSKLESLDVSVKSLSSDGDVTTIGGTFLKGEKDITDVPTSEVPSTEGFLTAVDLSSGKLEINASSIFSQSTVQAIGNIASLEGSLSPIPSASVGEETCTCDLDAFITAVDLEPFITEATLTSGDLAIKASSLTTDSITTKTIQSDAYLQGDGTPLVAQSESQVIDTSSFLTLTKLESLDVSVKGLRSAGDITTTGGTFLKGDKDITEVPVPAATATADFLTADDLFGGTLDIVAKSLSSQSTIRAAGDIISSEGRLSPVPEPTCACDLEEFVTNRDLRVGNLNITAYSFKANNFVDSPNYLQNGEPLSTDTDVSGFLTSADLSEYATRSELQQEIRDISDGLSNFVTESDLNNAIANLPPPPNVDNFVTQDQLAAYATKADLEAATVGG